MDWELLRHRLLGLLGLVLIAVLVVGGCAAIKKGARTANDAASESERV